MICLIKKVNNYLFTVLLLSTGPSLAANDFNAKKQQRLIVKSVSKIFSDDEVEPSGRWGQFVGKKRVFTRVNRSKELNSADQAFGSFLYQIYDTYCLKKVGAKNCLQNRLNVQFSLSGSARLHAKKIKIKVGKKMLSANRFHQATALFLNYLSNKFGDPKFTKKEKKILFPKYQRGIRLNFHTILPKRGLGQNNLWQHEGFLNNFIKYLNNTLNMGATPFILNNVKIYRTPKLYKNDNLANIWWEFVDKGEKQLKKFDYKSIEKKGEIGIVVTGPNSGNPGEGGTTEIERSEAPTFIIKRNPNSIGMAWNDPELLFSATMNFLHELGHNTLMLEHPPLKNPKDILYATNIMERKAEFKKKLMNHFKKIGAFKNTPLWRY